MHKRQLLKLQLTQILRFGIKEQKLASGEKENEHCNLKTSQK
jgi:hypothetical protein